jgi:hypothetical protein
VARRVLAARLPGMRPLALLILVLAISACSGGDDDSGPETSSSASSSVSASTDASVATTVPVSTVPPTTISPTTISPTTSPPTTAPTTVPPTTVPPSTVPPTTVPPTTAPPAGRPIIDDLVDADEVLNIAHAGGDQAWPHSTFYAFDRAVEAGADMLEMDVQLTGDGVLIVQHDDTVDGTTNGTGDVASFTFADITQLDAAYWYVPGCWPCRDRPEEEYVLRGVRTGERPAPDGVDPNTLRIV